MALVCTQAKLTLVPFDMPEAETELGGGAYIEYSGPPLAMFKLTRAMMLFTMPVFLVVVFAGGAVASGRWGRLLGLLLGWRCSCVHRGAQYDAQSAYRPGGALLLGTRERWRAARGRARMDGMVTMSFAMQALTRSLNVFHLAGAHATTAISRSSMR